ncbi:hypothetical protein [Salicibibacter kimchii]|uniref:Uncharacterized protein n=1 Tax=Salicibibacter kimchii TaxID=2099786 RepID=A0A345BX66_9BACI|nr:hypothetical protein [Salicibibacter kimchii]AXF55547.1 hypothetical protein DT065_05615 [Salicibibacter kimchii]
MNMRVKHFIMATKRHMSQGLFVWNEKIRADPWQMLKLESIQEIENRVHQSQQNIETGVYLSTITDYMYECRRFLPENHADQLETFLLKRYGIE